MKEFDIASIIEKLKINRREIDVIMQYLCIKNEFDVVAHHDHDSKPGGEGTPNIDDKIHKLNSKVRELDDKL